MKNRYYVRVAYFFFLLTFTIEAFSIVAHDYVSLSDMSGKVRFPESKAYFLEDKNDKLDLRDVLKDTLQRRFIRSGGQNLNFGFTGSAYWVKFKLEVNALDNEGWLLACDNITLNFIDFYLVDNEGQLIKEIHTGNRRAFESRDVNHRCFVFKLPVKKNNRYYVYMKFKSEDLMSFMIGIWPSDKYWNVHYHLQMIEGLYFGAMLIMACYNAFLFFTIFDFSYLYYVLYICASLMLQLEIGGWFVQYVYNDIPEFSSKAGIIFFGIAVFFSIRFIENFISRKHLNRFIINLFYIIKVVGLMEMVIGVFIPLPYNLPFILIFCIIVIVPSIFYSTIYSYYKGYKSSIYLIWGWSTINFGAIVFCIANLGIIDFNFMSTYGLQIGTTIEVLFFSFALADRINIMRLERQKAQKEIIIQLEHNGELLHKLNEEQKRVFSAVLWGEENERKRLASELHDGIGQLLSVVKLHVSSLDQWIDNKNKQSSELVNKIVDLVDDSCRELRDISHNLMPNTVIQYGLITAIEDFVKKVNRTYSVKLHFQNFDFEFHLNPHTETTLYRIIEEIVNNALKHSNATDIYIQLIKENETELTVMIEDNGQGFDTSIINENDKYMGIKNIISRIEYIKGKVQIDSAPGRGTCYNINMIIESNEVEN